MGDVKLAAVLGLFLGPRGRARDLRRADRGHRSSARSSSPATGAKEGRKKGIPFGPWLAFGGLVGLFAGDDDRRLVPRHLHVGLQRPRVEAPPGSRRSTWAADTRSDESRQPPSPRHSRRLQGLRRARRRPGGQGRRGRVRRPRRARRLRRRRRGLSSWPTTPSSSAAPTSPRSTAQQQAARSARPRSSSRTPTSTRWPRRASQTVKRPRRLALRLGAGAARPRRAPSRPTSR